MERCSVSVVIPYYRANKTIERALASIACQSILPEEVILVDDNGDHDDVATLERLAGKYPIINLRVLRNEENRGAAFSRNRGWDSSGSKYIAFLDSDDSWEPDKLEVQYTLMEKMGAILSGHTYHFYTEEEDGDRMDIIEVSFKSLLIRNIFVTPSVMILRDIKERFDPEKRYVDDHLLWLLVTGKNEGKVLLIKRSMAVVYKNMYGEAGLSSHLWRMEKGELDTYRQVWSNSLISTPMVVLLFIYSLTKFIRRIIILLLRRK